MQSERERAARFLNRDADDQLLHARIRGLRRVEVARSFLEFEADHQKRQSVIAAINRRIKEIEAQRPVAADGRGLEAGDGCPECGAELREQTVRGEVGLWCPDCADFRGESA